MWSSLQYDKNKTGGLLDGYEEGHPEATETLGVPSEKTTPHILLPASRQQQRRIEGKFPREIQSLQPHRAIFFSFDKYFFTL